jgi:hypothetical protein
VNYRGSYRRLRDNAKSSMVAAIEIYNKPRFEYRDEVFAILLLNAWELLLKAVTSKGGKSIYYKKRRGEPYRTVGWRDALRRAEKTRAWPRNIAPGGIEGNLDHLAKYRDNAVHFYNAAGFGVVIYSLAQTAITNFRDLLRDAFGHELADEITWQLLPLGVEPPLDPISYLRGKRPSDGSAAVDEFLGSLRVAAEELESAGIDTGRLMTVYGVRLQSIKKLEQADVVVGVAAASAADDPVFIERRVDPRISHPYRQKDVVERVGSIGDRRFTSYDFQAIVFAHGYRRLPGLCYQDEDVQLTRWSAEVVALIGRMSVGEVDDARRRYRNHQRRQRAG